MNKNKAVFTVLCLSLPDAYAMQLVELSQDSLVEIAKFTILGSNDAEQLYDPIQRYCNVRKVCKLLKTVADNKSIAMQMYEIIAQKIDHEGRFPDLGKSFLVRCAKAIQTDNVPLFYFFCKAYPDQLNEKIDETGGRILHYAAGSSEQVTKFLLTQSGITVNATDDENLTALNYATDDNVKQILINAGCKVNKPDYMAIKDIMSILTNAEF